MVERRKHYVECTEVDRLRAKKKRSIGFLPDSMGRRKERRGLMVGRNERDAYGPTVSGQR